MGEHHGKAQADQENVVGRAEKAGGADGARGYTTQASHMGAKEAGNQ